MKNLQELLSTPIDTVEQAKQYIENLHSLDKSYNFDDDPIEIINLETKKRIFSDEECILAKKRSEEMYSQEWEEGQCPCGHLYDLIYEK